MHFSLCFFSLPSKLEQTRPDLVYKQSVISAAPSTHTHIHTQAHEYNIRIFAALASSIIFSK